jgi:hypothetical protein
LDSNASIIFTLAAADNISAAGDNFLPFCSSLPLFILVYQKLKLRLNAFSAIFSASPFNTCMTQGASPAICAAPPFLFASF